MTPRSPDKLVVGGGWLLTYFGDVQCVYFGPEVDDESFEAFVETFERDIAERSDARRVGVLYYVPETAAMGSPRRRRVAKVLSAYEGKLKRTTLAYAMATRSPFVRGVLSTMFWLAPPGYPYKMVASVEQGLGFISEHVLALDRGGIEGGFGYLLRERLDKTG